MADEGFAQSIDTARDAAGGERPQALRAAAASAAAQALRGPARRQADKIDRRVVKTRAAIRRAFRKLLKEKGLGKLTVSALAREADIDRKTFYLHYDSIDDLIDKEADTMVDDIISTTVSTARAGADYMGRVRAALSRVNELVVSDIELFEYMARNLSMDFVIGLIEKAVARYAERGPGGGRLGSEEVVYKMRFYLAGAVAVYSEWLCSDRSKPIGSVADVVAEALSEARWMVEQKSSAQERPTALAS